MIFIQKQILLLLALLSGSGELILASAKTSSLFCSWGFRLPDPQQGASHWGPGRLTDSTAGREPLALSVGYFGYCLMDVQVLFAALISTTVKAVVIDTLDKTLYESSVQKNPFQQPGCPVNCMDTFSAS